MPDPVPPTSEIRLLSLAQLCLNGGWQLELAHDRAEALLIWITKGQGLALLDGRRRGLGIHNAIFLPPRSLMALAIGRQGYGQALVIPPRSGLPLPDSPLHLRLRDVTAQSDLTALLEALGREQTAQRDFSADAVAAYAALSLIWLRRQDAAEQGPVKRPTAAQRLMRRYCARIVSDHASGQTMADHAAALGVTPTHLTRVCRNETGRTAAALLTERVVHAARQALIATDRPAKEIAATLGFGSAAYFTRFMQLHTGRPPSELRRTPARGR